MKQSAQATSTPTVQKAMYLTPCMKVTNVEAAHMMATSQQEPSEWEEMVPQRREYTPLWRDKRW